MMVINQRKSKLKKKKKEKEVFVKRPAVKWQTK